MSTRASARRSPGLLEGSPSASGLLASAKAVWRISPERASKPPSRCQRPSSEEDRNTLEEASAASPWSKASSARAAQVRMALATSATDSGARVEPGRLRGRRRAPPPPARRWPRWPAPGRRTGCRPAPPPRSPAEPAGAGPSAPPERRRHRPCRRGHAARRSWRWLHPGPTTPRRRSHRRPPPAWPGGDQRRPAPGPTRPRPGRSPGRPPPRRAASSASGVAGNTLVAYTRSMAKGKGRSRNNKQTKCAPGAPPSLSSSKSPDRGTTIPPEHTCPGCGAAPR